MTADCSCTSGTACSDGAGCSGCADDLAAANLPGQSELHWRTAPHGAALARMRSWLAGDSQPLDIRSLSHQGTDDPAIALLDTWAVVTDVVSFYTERIAQEGFLRTATERDSVRQQARSLGYELRPGVSAQAELAFDVETAPGSPEVVVVPAGTPVQTVPAPGKLPQTFETTAELEARAAWNSVAAYDRVGQPFGFGIDSVWLDTTTSGVKVDDRVLVVGSERAGVAPGDAHSDAHEKWDFRRVTAVDVDPLHTPGWTRLTLDRPLGYRRSRNLVAEKDVRVYRLGQRLNLFGWNAPDPTLLDSAKVTSWKDFDLKPGSRELEVDGDVPAIVPGSWLVLEQPGHTEAFQVESVNPDGATKYALSGKLTRVTLDISEHLDDFDRNHALVHAVSRELPAAWMPRPDLVGSTAPGGGHVLDLVPTEPVLPKGREIVVTGTTDTDESAVEATRLTAAASTADGVMTITVDPPLANAYHAGTVRVRANVAVATHGETVEQVLGSGDGRRAFASFDLRRPPLTFVRSTTVASGAVPALEVRVEDVEWTRVDSLFEAGPRDRVYIVRQAESGTTTVTFGDGVHGSRLPTGVENVRATYRVGIGEDGAAEPDQVRLPVRKPRGVASVTNLGPAHDWAPSETLEEARLTAPQRVRTLDRAVSVTDYEDFARGYSGIGRARADLVWDGRIDTVVVSVLASTGDAPADSLVADLRDTLDDARETRAPRVVLPAEVVDVGARLRIEVDPLFEVPLVRGAVEEALLTAFGSMELATPLASSAALVVAAAVPGVVSVTMPELTGGPVDDLLVAEPGRWGPPASAPAAAPRLLPAQALRLTAALLDVQVVAR
ncbi:baseplate J/gp47 family protein [Humibacillus xanthopallidus]|uniref:Putative phage baseplate assembly protein n=1 Tax=Humibacillus xanthopallidus TaxID=412689 RepID=A0A543I2X4_9MICO|nr:baseplate J/gp47 family protein [Humibacillus xanthopallidus]TQM64944.1 putative phage baseplate assembly protein [Humibacillus xanthopallidus]